MSQEESIGPVIEKFQRIEITEHHIYKRLAKSIKDPENSKILNQIADDELRHYNDWKKYTQRDIKPNMWDVWKYYLISRIFGFTFGIKLMEQAKKKPRQITRCSKAKSPTSTSGFMKKKSTSKNCLPCWMKNACAMPVRWCWV